LEGVRHHPVDRARIDAGRRVGHRAGDVAHLVRRRQRLRRRLRDRGVPVRAGAADPGAQRPALPEGGLMAAIAAEHDADVSSTVPNPDDRWSAGILRFVTKLPVHIFLIIIALLWLVPTIGLLVTSLLAPVDFNNKGWWQVFSEPSKLTWTNYDSVLH